MDKPYQLSIHIFENIDNSKVIFENIIMRDFENIDICKNIDEGILKI